MFILVKYGGQIGLFVYLKTLYVCVKYNKKSRMTMEFKNNACLYYIKEWTITH